MARIRWYLPPVLLSIQPLVVVIGANLGNVPLRPEVMLRSVLAAIGATLVILAALRLLQRDLAARAAWLSCFLFLFNLYGAIAEGVRLASLPIAAADALLAVPYVLTCGVIAAMMTRPWEVRPRDATPLTAAAVVFLLAGLAPAAAAERNADPSWRASADALIASALSHEPKARSVPPRDIYYIVLDSLGRADALQRNFQLDLAPAVAALKARGFYVADGARSNYSQTYLSLASTLNVDYLDAVARAVGPTTTDRAPLHYLIQENALMRLASRAGYRIVAIGSDYMATEQVPQADVCFCSVSGLDELESAAMALTPLAAVLAGRVAGVDFLEAHRRKVVDTFATLESYRRGPQPAFVFAHVLAPHPPFVLARDGSPLALPAKPYNLAEWRESGGPQPSGELQQGYISGYREQSLYVLDRVTAIVDAALRQPGPPPVIVVHGDHGPGLRVNTGGSNEASMRQRMEIFAAYHFPDGADGLYPTMTPVNGARLLASTYLGAELPPLPDRVMFSPGARPYEFVPVPAVASQDSISPVRIR
jgi:hypothetical protein